MSFFSFGFSNSDVKPTQDVNWKENPKLIRLATRAANRITKRIQKKWTGEQTTLRFNMRNCIGYRQMLEACYTAGGAVGDIQFYVAFAQLVRKQLRKNLRKMQDVNVRVTRKDTTLKVYLTPLHTRETNILKELSESNL